MVFDEHRHVRQRLSDALHALIFATISLLVHSLEHHEDATTTFPAFKSHAPFLSASRENGLVRGFNADSSRQTARSGFWSCAIFFYFTTVSSRRSRSRPISKILSGINLETKEVDARAMRRAFSTPSCARSGVDRMDDVRNIIYNIIGIR